MPFTLTKPALFKQRLFHSDTAFQSVTYQIKFYVFFMCFASLLIIIWFWRLSKTYETKWNGGIRLCWNMFEHQASKTWVENYGSWSIDKLKQGFRYRNIPICVVQYTLLQRYALSYCAHWYLAVRQLLTWTIFYLVALILLPGKLAAWYGRYSVVNVVQANLCLEKYNM